jgi:anti-sigma factor RsiW
MPHVPDLHAHADHDPELIAAHAAGDLSGAALATVSDLLAACTSCAELHADLRLIAAATATVPAPARTRDFRITPAQAERLRPSGWRRFVAAFAAPKLAFTAPLGSGLAALGIAGIFLAAAPGAVPTLVEFSPTRQAIEGPTVITNSGQEGQPTDGGAPGAGGGAPGAGGVPEPGATLPPDGTDLQGEVTNDPQKAEQLAAQAEAERVRQAEETLFLLGGGALVAGLGLVGLRWSSRRFV